MQRPGGAQRAADRELRPVAVELEVGALRGDQLVVTAAPSSEEDLRLVFKSTLDWTPTAANAFQATDLTSGAVMTCVATGAYKSNITPAVSHARCAGLAPGP